MAIAKVDRGMGIAKLGMALAIILAGGAYALFQAREEAKAPPPKPAMLQLDSQKKG